MRATMHSGAAVLTTILAFTIPAAGAERPATYPLSITRGSRLMLDARINGRPVNALLDSAAEMTLLDRAFAQSLNLTKGQAAAGQGSGQAGFDALLVEGVSLSALGLSLENQTVAVVDLGDVGRRLLKRPVDVILGRELFDAARLTIDIDGRRIGVVPRAVAPPGVRLSLVPEHGVETVPVQVEGSAPVRATFDLGNGSQILISMPFAARLHLLTDGRSVATESGGGLGGETTRRVVTLRYIELAGRRFKGLKAAIDPQPSASDVNIGVSVLRHFRITSDFAEHAVWLDPR